MARGDWGRRGGCATVRCLGVLAAAGVSLLGCKDSGGGGGGGACGAFSPCGGDVVGTWELRQVCLDADIEMLAGLDEPACSGAVGRVDVMPDATLSVTSDALTLAGSFTLSMELTFTDACIQALSGEPSVHADAAFCSRLQDLYNQPDPDNVVDSASCSFGAGACRCTAYSLPNDISESGSYRVEGTMLVDGAGAGEDFCVEGDTLTLHAEDMAMGYGGQLVFGRH